MKYKLIIQELKKSTDQNVRVFANEVEGMKRLTTEQRKSYLANLQKTESISLLVKDFIPYIIWVAYANSGKTKILSVLDLVNEGIIGAYRGLEKSYWCRKNALRSVRSHIRYYIVQITVRNSNQSTDGKNNHLFINKKIIKHYANKNSKSN